MTATPTRTPTPAADASEPPPRKLGNLAARLLVAAIAAPVLLFAMHQPRPEWTWAFVLAGSLIAMQEFFAMTLDDAGDRRAGVVIGAAAVALLYWVPAARGGALLAVVVAVILPGLYYLFRFGELATVALRYTATVCGIAYAGVLFTCIALIKRDFGADGGHLVMLVLLVTWIADTGAYFAGRAFGRKKLYPAISPGKTWAGVFGGIAGGVAAAAGMKLLALPHLLSWLDVVALSAPGAVLGMLGDLVESMIKRSRGVKDSGSILPGHGGILDRVDAVLFYAPYVYFYLLFAN
jgi:phosphatidate cytidylyltransferase